LACQSGSAAVGSDTFRWNPALHVRGRADAFQAEVLIEDGYRVRACGRCRHLEGTHNSKVRLYGAHGWRSWPSRQVDVRPIRRGLRASHERYANRPGRAPIAPRSLRGRGLAAGGGSVARATNRCARADSRSSGKRRRADSALRRVAEPRGSDRVAVVRAAHLGDRSRLRDGVPGDGGLVRSNGRSRRSTLKGPALAYALSDGTSTYSPRHGTGGTLSSGSQLTYARDVKRGSNIVQVHLTSWPRAHKAGRSGARTPTAALLAPRPPVASTRTRRPVSASVAGTHTVNRASVDVNSGSSAKSSAKPAKGGIQPQG
jgi:hypothetical protein